MFLYAISVSEILWCRNWSLIWRHIVIFYVVTASREFCTSNSPPFLVDVFPVSQSRCSPLPTHHHRGSFPNFPVPEGDMNLLHVLQSINETQRTCSSGRSSTHSLHRTFLLALSRQSDPIYIIDPFLVEESFGPDGYLFRYIAPGTMW